MALGVRMEGVGEVSPFWLVETLLEVVMVSVVVKSMLEGLAVLMVRTHRCVATADGSCLGLSRNILRSM